MVPAGQLFSYDCPFVAVYFMQIEHLLLFALAPAPLLNARVEVVVPSM